MANKMVRVVDAQSSKEDEIGAIKKMAECAGDGSYLASLFTPEFVGWVESRVRDDLPPNVWWTWQCDVKHAYDVQASLRDEVELLYKAARVRERVAGEGADDNQLRVREGDRAGGGP